MSNTEGALAKERDLYLKLLELCEQEDIEKLLEEALRCIVNATEAARGYVEISPAVGGEPWSMSHGCTQEETTQIRAVVSRGIVSRAIAEGRTIQTPSALLDERFAAQPSVRQHAIEAVLCAPIGRQPIIGVIYLQGRSGGGPFDAGDVALAEKFARHVAPAVRTVVEKEAAKRAGDPTAPWRSRLKVDAVAGRSSAFAQVLENVAAISRLDLTVLITGPNGTGKTQLAQVIHANSARGAGALLEVSCTNLTESLFESELFGSMAGAHSTADRDRPGKVAAAERGTLFLDEIGDLSITSQVKLLQFLQKKTYFPLGSSSAQVADVRIIAATNRDLEELVREGSFREDLYYRLAIMPIRMPALAERVDDIIPLAEQFADAASRRHGIPRARFSPGAKLALELAQWPGNVRQLMNVVERGMVRAAAEQQVELEARHLFPDADRDPPADAQISFQEATRRFHRSLLEQTLSATNWNISEAARQLDLTRQHVHNLIRATGLTRRGARE